MTEEHGKTQISEIEELDAVAEFIDKLKDSLKDILDILLETISGKKIGEDVAQFYESLKARRLPDEIAIKLTEEYFRKRIETISSLNELFKQFTEKRGFTKPDVKVLIEKEKQEEKGEK